MNTLRLHSRNKVFHVVFVFAVIFFAFCHYLSTLTIVDQQKILLDLAFAAVSLIGIGFAMLLGVTSVAGEIESRTIYLLLSKPVTRTEFLLGKYFAGALVALLIHGFFYLFLRGTLAWLHLPAPAGMLGCFYLMSLESTVVFAAAMLFSLITTKFLAAGFAIGFFIIGRSSQSIAVITRYDADHAEAGRALGKWIQVVIPNLRRWDVRDAVAYNKGFPADLIWQGTIFALLFCTMYLLLSVLVFRKKDIP